MKFKVQDLINSNKEIANLFLSCITKELATEITSKENYNIDTSEVDMKLYIEDKEVDINKFITTLMDNYYIQIKKEATKLVKKNLSGRASEITDILNDIQNKLECLENDISWEDKLLK